MKKKFFLHKTVSALTDKQVQDLDQIFGGLRDVPVEIYYPTIAAPMCPDGFYWHSGVNQCLKNGTYPELPADKQPARLG
ncbi:hypothetical protein [uncultured Kordia sp.]|uniref:hypothetical protein n=1 Tax=uncultured Kordia sp. TaxID=507699 RepID=UPI00261B5228|nr:hypothetical protein [uncultured Kordia sp.]